MVVVVVAVGHSILLILLLLLDAMWNGSRDRHREIVFLARAAAFDWAGGIGNDGDTSLGNSASVPVVPRRSSPRPSSVVFLVVVTRSPDASVALNDPEFRLVSFKKYKLKIKKMNSKNKQIKKNK